MALALQQQLNMVAAQRQAVRARPLTQPTVLPPPLRGWNTRDPFEAMDPQDAIQSDNWQPDYGGVRLREGCRAYAQLAGGEPVSTLAIFRTGTTEDLLAALGDRVVLVDSGAVLAAGFQNAWWQTAQFNQRLFWVNGQDLPQIYDGVTLAPAAFAAAAGSPYPLDVRDLVGVAVIHNRLYFWTGREPGFWYGDLYAIQGDLHYFPFEMTVSDGAFVVNIQPLTYDGGLGIATYTVFTLSTGDILVYSGTDPSDPANWSLQGNFMMPPPLGVRALTRFGGDAYIVTSSDYAKLSQLLIALKAGAMPVRSRAAGACQAAVEEGRTLTGWQMIYWGFGRRLVVNVPRLALHPVTGRRQFDQHVYHAGLDAWCRYQGLPAFCWLVWGDRLLFGGDQGMVNEFGGYGRDELLPGQFTAIQGTVQQAWNLFGTPLQKRFAAIRPIVRSALTVRYTFGLGYDYGAPDLVIEALHFGVPTPWNTTPWGSPWERSAATDAIWYVLEGDGSAASIAMHAASPSPDPLIWVRTDLRIEPGSML